MYDDKGNTCYKREEIHEGKYMLAYYISSRIIAGLSPTFTAIRTSIALNLRDRTVGYC